MADPPLGDIFGFPPMATIAQAVGYVNSYTQVGTEFASGVTADTAIGGALSTQAQEACSGTVIYWGDDTQGAAVYNTTAQSNNINNGDWVSAGLVSELSGGWVSESDFSGPGVQNDQLGPRLTYKSDAQYTYTGGPISSGSQATITFGASALTDYAISGMNAQAIYASAQVYDLTSGKYLGALLASSYYTSATGQVTLTGNVAAAIATGDVIGFSYPNGSIAPGGTLNNLINHAPSYVAGDWQPHWWVYDNCTTAGYEAWYANGPRPA